MEIVEGIRRHGIAHAAQTTIAPPPHRHLAGTEGYCCEPVFELGFF